MVAEGRLAQDAPVWKEGLSASMPAGAVASPVLPRTVRPSASSRTAVRSIHFHGMKTTLNLNDQGRMTGELPGQVLRGPLYRQQKAAA